MESVFELEKKILKAQSPKEIDEITRKMNTSQLRNVIKLLVDRMTPTNVKINRIQNSWNDDFLRKGNDNMNKQNLINDGYKHICTQNSKSKMELWARFNGYKIQ